MSAHVLKMKGDEIRALVARSNCNSIRHSPQQQRQQEKKKETMFGFFLSVRPSNIKTSGNEAKTWYRKTRSPLQMGTGHWLPYLEAKGEATMPSSPSRPLISRAYNYTSRSRSRIRYPTSRCSSVYNCLGMYSPHRYTGDPCTTGVSNTRPASVPWL